MNFTLLPIKGHCMKKQMVLGLAFVTSFSLYGAQQQETPAVLLPDGQPYQPAVQVTAPGDFLQAHHQSVENFAQVKIRPNYLNPRNLVEAGFLTVIMELPTSYMAKCVVRSLTTNSLAPEWVALGTLAFVGFRSLIHYAYEDERTWQSSVAHYNNLLKTGCASACLKRITEDPYQADNNKLSINQLNTAMNSMETLLDNHHIGGRVEYPRDFDRQAANRTLSQLRDNLVQYGSLVRSQKQIPITIPPSIMTLF